MFLFHFLFALLLAPTLANDKFTAAEMQQISIETPGLFDKSNPFTIDLTAIKPNEYSFPLPVGKATAVAGNAVEITTKKGDAVKAMFAGTVRLARKTKKYGNVIVIRHANGLETVYAHNAQNLVKAEQKVEAGQTIAIVGNIGAKTACLFTVMINGGRINPAIILDIKNHRLRSAILTCEKKGTRINISTATKKNLSDTEKEKKTKAEEKTKEEKDKGKEKTTAAEDKTATERHEKPTTRQPKPTRDTNSNQLVLADFADDEWAYPLPGSKVISPYGGRRRHSGVDIKTKPNDNILAAFSGIVTRSGPFFGYGNCIVIRHENGFETLYSHQSKNLVKVGQAVKAGDVIGLTGRTGRATTEHLHFEVHFKGRRFDPSLVFNHNSKQLKRHTLVNSGGVVKVKK